MKRCKTYAECEDCIYGFNSNKCSDYAGCKVCPNYTDKGCACTLDIPDGEQKCPYFKDDRDEYQEK